MSVSMFSIRQVARMLRVGDREVRRWIRAGELTVVNLGNADRAKHRVSQQDLDKFLESRRVVAKAAEAVSSRRKTTTGRRWF